MKRMLSLMCVLMAAGVAAGAEIQEEQRCDALPGGQVHVKNVAGAVKLSSWEKNEVFVHAVMEKKSGKLHLDCTQGHVEISVSPKNMEADLTISVPAQSSLGVETVSASIAVERVAGTLKFESVSGDIGLAGDAQAIFATTVSGDITLKASAAELEAQSVSGDIVCAGDFPRLKSSNISGDLTFTGAIGSASLENTSGSTEIKGSVNEVEAATIGGDIIIDKAAGRASLTAMSGDLRLVGEGLKDAGFETVSGDVEYKGDLAPNGALRIEAKSGPVHVALPESTAAVFNLHTLSGGIHSAFGAGQQDSLPGQGHSLRFTQGDGGGSVKIDTLSGSIELSRR